MPNSGFSNVLRFVVATWILYLLILFFIGEIPSSARQYFGSIIGQDILTLMAGVLMLAPFIVLWDWYVLERYYPARVRELLKREASQPHPQSD